jgi:hypothetical protein
MRVHERLVERCSQHEQNPRSPKLGAQLRLFLRWWLRLRRKEGWLRLRGQVRVEQSRRRRNPRLHGPGGWWRCHLVRNPFLKGANRPQPERSFPSGRSVHPHLKTSQFPGSCGPRRRCRRRGRWRSRSTAWDVLRLSPSGIWRQRSRQRRHGCPWFAGWVDLRASSEHGIPLTPSPHRTASRWERQNNSSRSAARRHYDQT